MNKCEIIERLKNIAGYAVHTVGEEPFVMSLDDGIAVHEAIELLKKSETNCSEIPNNSDTISRQQAIDAFETAAKGGASIEDIKLVFENLPSVQPDLGKYEYHYDHTDCIWYRSEARNRCPVTCAQYRDGWNDAMNYIFRDGKGYRPYRRGEQYEE